MKYLILLLFILPSIPSVAQKMLVLERANSAKTVKMYVGDVLEYRLKGDEDYWYTSTINDILPENKVLLLDKFPVHVDSISALRTRRKPITRLVGGTLVTFGASLAFATTIGALYSDKTINYGALYGTSVASAGVGLLAFTRKKLPMGKKYRLRII
ncbi:MAG: hypothetical protein IT270_00640, partial [Saprospiraceae bacterium]|nr:hypothetical protein [Saprospiraceae bacterium]